MKKRKTAYRERQAIDCSETSLKLRHFTLSVPPIGLSNDGGGVGCRVLIPQE